MTDTALNGSAEPVEKAAKGKVDLSEIGSAAVTQWNGVLMDEYVTELQGNKAVTVYAEMEREPVIAGVLLAIDNMVRQVEWDVVPAPEERSPKPAESEKWAEFGHTCLNDMSSSWADTLSSIFSMIPFGWSWIEEVYKRRGGWQDPTKKGALPSSDFDDGLYGWRKLPLRPQESKTRWEFGPNGEIVGMWQRIFGSYEEKLIPLRRSLLFRTQTRGDNPEGRSALRAAHRPWWFKRQMEGFEGIGFERNLAGLPIAWVPPQWLSADATANETMAVRYIKELVTNVRRNANEGMVFPLAYDDKGNKTMDFTLLASPAQRNMNSSEVIVRYRQEMAMCVLADWLLLGHEQVGSRALAGSKIDMFLLCLEAWVTNVADVFNAHAFPRLMVANGVDPRHAPMLKPTKVADVDITAFAGAVSQLLSGQAITPGPKLESYSRQILGVPEEEEEDRPLSPGEQAEADLNAPDPDELAEDADEDPDEAKPKPGAPKPGQRQPAA